MKEAVGFFSTSKIEMNIDKVRVTAPSSAAFAKKSSLASKTHSSLFHLKLIFQQNKQLKWKCFSSSTFDWESFANGWFPTISFSLGFEHLFFAEWVGEWDSNQGLLKASQPLFDQRVQASTKSLCFVAFTNNFCQADFKRSALNHLFLTLI